MGTTTQALIMGLLITHTVAKRSIVDTSPCQELCDPTPLLQKFSFLLVFSVGLGHNLEVVFFSLSKLTFFELAIFLFFQVHTQRLVFIVM